MNSIVTSLNLLNITMYADDTTLRFEGVYLSQAMQITNPELEKKFALALKKPTYSECF